MAGDPVSKEERAKLYDADAWDRAMQSLELTVARAKAAETDAANARGEAARLHERLAEVERQRDALHEHFLRDVRGVEGELCRGCGGWGVRAYGSTATWHGGVGGQAVTCDVCDRCWGSGSEASRWPSWREHRATVEARDAAQADARGQRARAEAAEAKATEAERQAARIFDVLTIKEGVFREAVEVLREIEWHGPGWRPKGDVQRAFHCPLCAGMRPSPDYWRPQWQGHAEGCRLAALLSRDVSAKEGT